VKELYSFDGTKVLLVQKKSKELELVAKIT
jgi:hypothetical protein